MLSKKDFQPQKRNVYSYAFILPAAIIYTVIFVIPTFSSFFFSLTRWTIVDWEYIGLENFITFFKEPSTFTGLKNTLIYGPSTSALKVVIALLLAVLLTRGWKVENYLRSVVFFPTIISTVAVGLVFLSIMHPTNGLINRALTVFGIDGPHWLTNTDIALFSIIGVDVWKGLGVATLIYIAGIKSIPTDCMEAARIDGSSGIQTFFHIILPLVRPAMNSVIILSLIGGLRNFDLVWTMTGGGPGFATDILTTVVYKLYSHGLYGLSTAGNVILFVLISLIAFPVYIFLTSREEA